MAGCFGEKYGTLDARVRAALPVARAAGGSARFRSVCVKKWVCVNELTVSCIYNTVFSSSHAKTNPPARSRPYLVVVRTPPAPHARRPPRTLSSLLLEEEALGRLVRVRVRASGQGEGFRAQGSGEGWGPGEGLGEGLGVRARRAACAPSPRCRPWRRSASCSAGSRCPCRPTRPWCPGASGFAANRGASKSVGGCGVGVGWA